MGAQRKINHAISKVRLVELLKRVVPDIMRHSYPFLLQGAFSGVSAKASFQYSSNLIVFR